MRVAAMNPCPCGYFGSNLRACKCSPGQIARYLAKVSGPLVARTIADLEGSEDIRSEHVAEAISYRNLDRKL